MSRTVLVTGASRGVGRAVCQLLVRLGDDVVGVYRAREDAARSLEATVASERLRLLRADLAEPQHVTGLVSDLQIGVEALAGLVLCAGVSHHGSLDGGAADERDPLVELLRVNLEAPLRLLRQLLREGMLAEQASVVVVGSNLARRGVAGRAVYAASKAGLEGAVRSLAHELGPRGIRINAVAPGLLRTDMTADIGPQGYAAYAREVPLGRVGEAMDVAPVVAFLLDQASAYVTGQVLDVDGGWGA
ncbi:MAG: SDR family oxidoreductase [Deltaproteobacteria bacterium]|nr:SDR family oxidoreductase [Deltaproteobacteria bacterium]